ncbi:MAG: hypothetical protein A2Y15_01835 [Clostridiales bacterium GWF2_36_10]|nr:MAG: hypothetical protein A2Y15_01835 [Clostridiales bacterium GWF2_36_10]HAN21577.1 hypothetical protein [Clostridiales bacterium]
MFVYPVKISAIIEQETSINFSIYIYETETLFTYSQPKTLSLLTVKKNNEGYLAQYDGIEIEIDNGSIMATDALDLAVDTIRTSESCERQVQNGLNVLLFSIDGNNVLVYYNNESKIIDKIISEVNGQLFTYEILSIESIQT